MLEREIEEASESDNKKTLLLHACCAPCSSYVLEYLNNIFDITVFYYNPNITSETEYSFRASEIKRFLKEANFNLPLVMGRYEPEKFFEISKGHENEAEGNERCFECYRLRLRETAEYAKKNSFDCFTTTLSISPYKNADKLNSIGKELSEEYEIKYLFSDFKKKNGYKRSIELSEKYNLYRQNYCGCIYSYEEMRRRENDIL